MKKGILRVAIVLCCVFFGMVLNAQTSVYNVQDFGARGDGKTNDAAAIQKAIDACNQKGGGTVLLRNGAFLTGGLVLRSNVELHLAADASILGSPDLSKYNNDEKYVYKTLSHSLIYAEGCEHISITGEGKIDGQGLNFKTDPASHRPQLIHFRGCKDIRMSDIFLTNSGCFAAWIMQCERLKIDGVRIMNKINPNNDGIDIDGCRDVMISNCNITTEDDCLGLKTSEKGFVCKDVVITNCILSSHCAAIRVGPDALEDIENVAASNCVIRNTGLNGIKIQESMGAAMRNMTFSNIVMENVAGPISIRLAGWKIDPGMVWSVFDDSNWEKGRLNNILFDNIRATTPKNNMCMSITGAPHIFPQQITFSNIDITFTGGGTAAQAARRNVPDLERDYPEIYMFGDLPAYGLYMHHASGITLNNVHFHLEGEDLRPAIVCDDVTNLDLSGFKADGNKNAESLIRLENTKNVFIMGCRPLNEIGTFLRVEGKVSKDVQLHGNKMNNAARYFETTQEVANGTIQVLN